MEATKLTNAMDSPLVRQVALLESNRASDVLPKHPKRFSREQANCLCTRTARTSIFSSFVNSRELDCDVSRTAQGPEAIAHKKMVSPDDYED